MDSFLSPPVIKCPGRVNRVDVKYMFLGCSYGSVFVPLSAAVSPDEFCSDLRMTYNVGDVVHLNAKYQVGKNGCCYCATKVRRSSNAEEYQLQGVQPEQSTVHSDQIIVLTSVASTLAYGRNDDLGTVFIPGAAFPSSEVNRLTVYLSVGDIVKVDVRPQTEKSGCKWLATKACKMVTGNNCISGTGIVVALTESVASVWNEDYGKVQCSILTWCGGDLGREAEWLTDIIAIGEFVRFDATYRNDVLRATRWTGKNQSLGTQSVVTIADSNTQTSMTPVDMFVRSLDPATMDNLLSSKPMLRKLLEESFL